MKKELLLSGLFVTSIVYAQTIRSIEYQGLTRFSKVMAEDITGVHVGDQMDSSAIDDSILKLYNQGSFEDVWVDRKPNGKLVYHFKEKPSIANVEINGFGEDGLKVLNSLGIKRGAFYDKESIEEAKNKLTLILQSKGNYDSIVEAKVEKFGKNQQTVSVIFDVNKGQKIHISKVNFVGAKHLERSEIEDGLVNTEAGWLGWIPFLGGGEVKVEQLPYDAYKVKDNYMANGYLDVKVSKPLMKVDYSNYTAQIDYKIDEGIQYKVGSISISSDIKLDTLDKNSLISELQLKQNKVFNILKMRQDIRTIENAVGDLGYAYAKVSPQINKITQNGIVNIDYHITAGQKVTINDVIISGNNETKDRVVRRYIYLAPGDVYNATDLKDSKGALSRTGYFEKVDISTQKISENKINILVKVKEAHTGNLSFGGGYGSYEGFMVNASISDKNLFGTGWDTSFGFDFSEKSKNFNLSFVNPRIWDSLYSLGISLYKKDYEYTEYTEKSIGGTVYVGRQFTRHIYASVGIGYVDNESTYNEDYENGDYILYNDQYKKTSGFLNIKWDNTDDYYLPRKGYIASVNFEFASLDGDMKKINLDRGYKGFDNFTKVNAKFGTYYGLEDMIDYDMILRFKTRYTKIISDEDNYIPVAERLFMGGLGSIRGYQSYSLSPRYDGSRIGGTDRLSFSAEASVPLSEAANMRLAFFYDYAILKTDDVLVDGGNTMGFDKITRSSTGAMIEWRSPFGPINLVFAKPLDDEDDDKTTSFEFSMGTKF